MLKPIIEEYKAEKKKEKEKEKEKNELDRPILEVFKEKLFHNKSFITRHIKAKNALYLNIAPLTIFDNIIFLISRYYTS